MKKYAIITFIFGGYDKVREPGEIDPDCDYVMVTDMPRIPGSAWRFVKDDRLGTRSPLYSSFYVRYHPFDYTDAETAIVIDGSVQVKHPLAPILDKFIASGHDMCLMTGGLATISHKLTAWMNSGRAGNGDPELARRLMDKYRFDGNCTIGNAFRIFRRSKTAGKFNRHCWRCALAIGKHGDPYRIDDIIPATLISTVYSGIGVFLVSTDILQSYYMQYCKHGNDHPAMLRIAPKQTFRGEPADIHRFDPRYYPMSYGVKAEAMLLTKYLDENDLVEWLDWHLDTAKFDRVHIFDNGCPCDVPRIAHRYGGKVTVEHVDGHPRQYQLYDRHIETGTDAEWVMPIDDDEFLDIGNFGSVGEAIDYYCAKLDTYMIAVRWKHLFPEKFHTERTGPVLEYCTREDPALATQFTRRGDNGIKTIVRRFGKIHYQETWENPSGGHVPLHSMCPYALTCDGRKVRTCGVNCDTIDDERIRLLHCRYKGYGDWMAKYGNADPSLNCRRVCDCAPREKAYPFMKILDTLS